VLLRKSFLPREIIFVIKNNLSSLCLGNDSCAMDRWVPCGTSVEEWDEWCGEEGGGGQATEK
jgi:hypothetical protein